MLVKKVCCRNCGTTNIDAGEHFYELMAIFECGKCFLRKKMEKGLLGYNNSGLYIKNLYTENELNYGIGNCECGGSLHPLDTTRCPNCRSIDLKITEMIHTGDDFCMEYEEYKFLNRMKNEE